MNLPQIKEVEVFVENRELNNLKIVYYISGNHDLYYGLEELTNFNFIDNHRKTISFNGNDIHMNL